MKWVEWLAQVQKMVLAWRGMQTFSEDVGQLRWTLRLDPGKATGLAAVVYLEPPAEEIRTGTTVDDNGFKKSYVDRVSGVGESVRTWSKALKGIGAEQVPGDLLATYDATGTVVLSYWAEFLSGNENALVRKCVSRTRSLGAVWWGSPDWDGVEIEDDRRGELRVGNGLGAAGIGAEKFFLLRMDKDPDYLSPVRVTAAFSYAIEDEFGVRIVGDIPADALNTFGSIQLKRLGIWVKGPDHVRSALAHALFGIRKAYSK